jgi:hypothetical protein
LVEEIQAEFNQRLETEIQVVCFPVEARTLWELYRGSGSGEAESDSKTHQKINLKSEVERNSALSLRLVSANLL